MATVLPTTLSSEAGAGSPMTRLALVRRVYVECGLSGEGPSTTVDQTGEALQIVQYVDDAWTQIQQMRTWRWMWELASLTLVEGAQTIATEAIPANRYIKDSAMIDSTELDYLEWPLWRRAYVGEISDVGPPTEWTVRPDNVLQFNTIADADTTITVERYINPTAMDADDDYPEGLAAQHHMVIVWEAVRMYAGYDEASKLYQHATAMRALKLGALRTETSPVQLW